MDDPAVTNAIKSFFNSESDAMRKRHEERIPDSMKHQVDAILGADVSLALDVGSGPGTLLLELLHGGTDQVVGLDLSPQMNEVARRRLEEEDLDQRATLVEGSFLDVKLEVHPEAISLHRVLCCHPDREGMVKQSAQYHPRIITLSVPRDWKFMRLLVGIYGFVARFRKSFRPFIHSQDSIDDQLLQHGYQLTSRQKGMMWVTSTYELRE